MRKIYKVSTFLIIGLYVSLFTMSSPAIGKGVNDGGDQEIKKYTSALPFKMSEITLPQFPDQTFNIEDFGALGDGHTLNTDAIASAIDACAKAGGGRVVLPPGIWVTGPIKLQNNINLHIEKGAVVLFSTTFEDYPLVRTSWEGRPMVRCTSPLSGKDLENIAITGQGIFDGSGDAWRPALKNELTEHQWNTRLQSGGAVQEHKSELFWFPSQAAADGRELVKALDQDENTPLNKYLAAREYLRPVLLSLVNCKKVLLDGPTFQNSPAWNLHPLLCENMVIRHVTVKNPWYSTNGDGIDLESCRNVVMYDCHFDVGDDAICLKSGRDKYGRDRGVPSENISIADCIVYHGHGGFVIGSEMSGGVRNILIRDCVFLGTDVGLRFKSTRGRGGVVENIFIENILMEDIATEAIRFNMFYQNKSPTDTTSTKETGEVEIVPINEETPSFRKITIKNIVCRNANRAIYLQGLPELAIQDIEIDNVTISANTGLLGIDMEQIKLTNMTILPKKGPVMTIRNGQTVTIENVQLPGDEDVFLKLEGKKTGNIKLKDYDLSSIRKSIVLDKHVNAKAIGQ